MSPCFVACGSPPLSGAGLVRWVWSVEGSGMSPVGGAWMGMYLHRYPPCFFLFAAAWFGDITRSHDRVITPPPVCNHRRLLITKKESISSRQYLFLDVFPAGIFPDRRSALCLRTHANINTLSKSGSKKRASRAHVIIIPERETQ